MLSRTRVVAVQQIPRILALFFGLLFLVGVVNSVQTTLSLSQAFSPAETGSNSRELHVALFVPRTPSEFIERVVAGAEKATAAHDVAITVHAVDSDATTLHMARYSGIDGAIIYPSTGEQEARRRLDELHRAGIPVVLIEQSVTDESPWTFVGANNFDVGRRIGELAASGDEPARLAVVYSEKSPGVIAEKDLVELGINTVLGSQLAAPIIRKSTGLNPLDAESLTYQILRTMPDVNTIAFTDTADTLAALQVIIDLNLVGRVRVIGFGRTEGIEDYLDRGILAGTIVVDPERIGSEAVKALTGLIRDGLSPGYVDTGVEMVRGRP